MSTLTHSWAGTGCQEGYASSPMLPVCAEIYIPTSLNSHLNFGIFCFLLTQKFCSKQTTPNSTSCPPDFANMLSTWSIFPCTFLCHQTMYFTSYMTAIIMANSHSFPSKILRLTLPHPVYASKLLAWSMVLGTMGGWLTGETHKGNFWGDENYMYLD